MINDTYYRRRILLGSKAVREAQAGFGTAAHRPEEPWRERPLLHVALHGGEVALGQVDAESGGEHHLDAPAEVHAPAVHRIEHEGGDGGDGAAGGGGEGGERDERLPAVHVVAEAAVAARIRARPVGRAAAERS